MLRRMRLPSLLGARPRSDAVIAFSMDLMRPLSHGWMTICRGSGALIAASWMSGVSVPYASTCRFSTSDGAARPVRTVATS